MNFVVEDKDDFGCRDKKKEIGDLEVLVYKASEASKKSMVSPVKGFPQSFNFSAETKTEDTKTLVTGIGSFNIEMKHHEQHCLDYRTVSVPMQGAKSTSFSSKCFYN